MTKKADSVTSLPTCNVGFYDAIVWKDGKVVRVQTASLDPTANVRVEEISEAEAVELTRW